MQRRDERRKLHTLRLERLIVERKRPVDIVWVWAEIPRQESGPLTLFVRIDIRHRGEGMSQRLSAQTPDVETAGPFILGQ